MKFNFRLQTVLDVKEKWLKQKQDELAKLNMKKEMQKKEIELIHEKILKIESEINGDEHFTPSEQRLKYDYYHDLLHSLQFEEIKLAEIEEEILNKQQELINFSKEIKILESLKDKAFDEYKAKLQELNQKLLDELAIINTRVMV
ncbi:MAG: hypothetical protein Kow00108_17170 [Calditrichia bacterium]